MQQLPICLCEMLCSLLIELVAHSCTSCGVVQDEEVPLCRLLMIHLWQTLTAVSSSMHAYWMLYSLSWNVVAIKQKIKSLYFMQMSIWPFWSHENYWKLPQQIMTCFIQHTKAISIVSISDCLKQMWTVGTQWTRTTLWGMWNRIRIRTLQLCN